jgi:hypothetical protein
MTNRSLFQEACWYLTWLTFLAAVGLFVEWDVAHVVFGLFAFLFGVCAVLLLMLWLQQEAETLVRYCHEHHHEVKRRRRKPLSPTQCDQLAPKEQI